MATPSREKPKEEEEEDYFFNCSFSNIFKFIGQHCKKNIFWMSIKSFFFNSFKDISKISLKK